MVVNDSNLGPKSSKKFHCELCDYTTCKNSQYIRHISTVKHKKLENDSKMVVNDSNLGPKSSKKCDCGKVYNTRVDIIDIKRSVTKRQLRMI